LEPLCTAMTAIPPPLTSWSKHTQNRCVPDEIPAYWQKNDVITFLADTGMYDASLYHTLDDVEKERVLQFKSAYFKKRFVVAHSILRHILHHIPGTGNRGDAILMQEKNGRIRVRDRPDIFVSLSYSGSCIAVSVGKRKIGCDIEIVRPLEVRKIRSSPLFVGLTSGNGKADNQRLLHLWTLLEAYAKFHDMSLYPLTQDRFFFPHTHFVSYCIDRHAIVSLAYEGTSLKDTVLWMDPGCWPALWSAGKKAACLPLLLDGDTYVRA